MSISFLNLGKPWTETQSKVLKKLYIEDQLNLTQIAEMMGRDYNILVNNLVKLGAVKNTKDVRGFSEYKSSPYYAKIYNYYEEEKKNKNKTKNQITPTQSIIQTINPVKKQTTNNMFEELKKQNDIIIELLKQIVEKKLI